MIVADAVSIAKNEEELTILSSKEHVLHLEFPKGLIGLENQKQYTLYALKQGPLSILCALPSEQQFFYLINPYMVCADYVLDIQEEDYNFLHNPYQEDIMVFSIVTMQNPVENITCNLIGPIIINIKENIACQCVNVGERWKTKHLLTTGESVTV